jgi:hypothetical protein
MASSSRAGSSTNAVDSAVYRTVTSYSAVNTPFPSVYYTPSPSSSRNVYFTPISYSYPTNYYQPSSSYSYDPYAVPLESTLSNSTDPDTAFSPSPSSSSSVYDAAGQEYTNTNNTNATNPLGLPTPVFIGATSGVGVFVLIILGVGIWCCCRCRQKRRRGARRLRDGDGDDDGSAGAAREQGIDDREGDWEDGGEMRQVDLGSREFITQPGRSRHQQGQGDGEGESSRYAYGHTQVRGQVAANGYSVRRPTTLTTEEVRDILPRLPLSRAYSGYNSRQGSQTQIQPASGSGYRYPNDQSDSYTYSQTAQSHAHFHDRGYTLPAPSQAGSRGRESMWADDSEYDVMAEAGSTIARTLSTTSIATRARYSENGDGEGTGSGNGHSESTRGNPFDHPAYTYRRPVMNGLGSGSGTYTGTSNGQGSWNATTLSPISPTTPNSATPLVPWSTSMAPMTGTGTGTGAGDSSRGVSPSPSYHDTPQSHYQSHPQLPYDLSSSGSRTILHPHQYARPATQLPSLSQSHSSVNSSVGRAYLQAQVQPQPQAQSQLLARSQSSAGTSTNQRQDQQSYQNHLDPTSNHDAETQSIHSEDGYYERPSIDPRTGLRRAITIIRHSDATASRPGALSTRVEREGGRGAGLVELPPLYEEAVGR